jgi:uncharacterized repeat protein (TIGR03837 family)
MKQRQSGNCSIYWLSPICLCCVTFRQGNHLNAAKAHLGGEGPWQIGLLSVVPIPFLTQDEYDRLLWRCEVNFVRGEDSFVRAIWAGHPFVWQIYKQDEEAHLVKLAAFLDLYTKEMPPRTCSGDEVKYLLPGIPG